MSIFEAGMMVCWGASWPVAAWKTYKCKCVHGKSIKFSMLIMTGYILGVIHKVLYSHDWVILLYLLNMLFVFIDMVLWFKYRHNTEPQDE